MRVIVSCFEPKSFGECVWNSHVLIVLKQIIKNSLNILNRNHFFSVYVSTYYTKNIIVCCTGLSETLKSCNILSHTLILSLQNVTWFRKLAALYSATKSLHNSCTAKLQLFSSLLEAKQQLYSSCSGMQKRCAAFEGSLRLSAALLQRSCRLSNAAK